MKSRKWIGTVVVTLMVVALLATGGYALYRYGYTRGTIAARTGEGFIPPHAGPFLGGHMSEGFLDEHLEGMPFAGEHMREMPHGWFPGPDFDEMPQMFREHSRLYGEYEVPHMYGRGNAPRGGYSLLTGAYFSPFTALLKLLFLGFIAWLLYKVVSLFSAGKSWQLSFNAGNAEDVQDELKTKGKSKD